MKTVLAILAISTLCAFSQNSFYKADATNATIEAARIGDLEKVKTYIEKNQVDPNAQDEEGYTPLISAATGGHLQVVDYLLEHNAKLEEKTRAGQTALAAAINSDHYQIANRLIVEGADVNGVIPNNKKDTFLIGAAGSNLETTKLLLDKNQDLINQTNSAGETALFRSVYYGNDEVTKYLIKQGAKKDIKNNKGFSALDIAKQNKDQEVIKILSTKE